MKKVKNHQIEKVSECCLCGANTSRDDRQLGGELRDVVTMANGIYPSEKPDLDLAFKILEEAVNISYGKKSQPWELQAVKDVLAGMI